MFTNINYICTYLNGLCRNEQQICRIGIAMYLAKKKLNFRKENNYLQLHMYVHACMQHVVQL